MASIKLQQTKKGFSDILKVATLLRPVLDGLRDGFDALTESGRATRSMDGLAASFGDLEDQADYTTRASNRTAASFKTMGNRLVAIGGPFGAFISSLQQTRQAVSQARQSIQGYSSTPGGMAKSFLLNMAMVAKGLSMMAQGASKAFAAINEYTFAWRDQAKTAVRGTSLMASNTKALVANQRAVHEHATSMDTATGIGMAASTELTAAILDTMNLTGESAKMSAQELDDYGKHLGQTSKLIGLSAGEMGEFNRNLQLNLRMSKEASKSVITMTASVAQFGLNGRAAMDVLKENNDAILAVDLGGREKFIERLLESAATFQKAGVDFKKYSAKLLESKGIEAIKKTAMLGAFAGVSGQEVFGVKKAAEAGDAKAQIRLMEIQSQAFSQFLAKQGIDQKKYLDQQTKFRTGELAKPEQEDYLNTTKKLEVVLGTDVIGQQIFDGLGIDKLLQLPEVIRRSEEARAEIAKKGGAKAATAQDIAKMEEANATTGERTQKNMAEIAKRAASMDENIWKGMETAKVLADTTNKILEAINGVTEGLAMAAGGIVAVLLGGFGMLRGAFGLLKAGFGGLKSLGGLFRGRGGGGLGGLPPTPTPHVPGGGGLGGAGRSGAAANAARGAMRNRAVAKAAEKVGAKAAVKAGEKAVVKVVAKEAAEVAAKTGAKVAAKSLGKSILKKIPGISILAGLFFGAQRVMAGDWAGAGAEVASGAAGTIPGVGTAASIAIDAGLAARDIHNASTDAHQATEKVSKHASEKRTREEMADTKHSNTTVEAMEKVQKAVEDLKVARIAAATAQAKVNTENAVQRKDVEKMISLLQSLLDETQTLAETLSMNTGGPDYT